MVVGSWMKNDRIKIGNQTESCINGLKSYRISGFLGDIELEFDKKKQNILKHVVGYYSSNYN